MFVDKNDIPKQDYFVLCDTITYNQAPYIVDTMNGLSMQQTNFQYACYIIDDASTDGEQDVIRAYLNEHFQMDKAEQYELELANVIVVKHNTNPNCTFAVYLLKRNLWKEPDLKYSHRKPWTDRCKYIALCEGDDYWTDPLKLQRQVEYMDMHLDCSACFHPVVVKSSSDNDIHMYDYLQDKDYSILEIAAKWTIPTCSILFRVGVLTNEEIPPYILHGDIFLFLRLAEKGSVHCLNFNGGVYNRMSGGISQGNVPLINNIKLWKQWIYMSERFPQTINALHSTLELFATISMLQYIVYEQQDLNKEWKSLINMLQSSPVGKPFITKAKLCTFVKNFHLGKIVLLGRKICRYLKKRIKL